MTIRILITDDHAVLRAGLRLLFTGQHDMEVVGEAADGLEALSQVEQTKPDVVLMDLAMVRQAGIPAIKRIRELSPATRVLVLTMYADPAYLRMALAAGAAGYVVKSAAYTELLEATRAVARGGTFVDRSFDAQAVLEAIDPKPRKEAERRTGSLAVLSPREREVFELLIHGFTNPQVATHLGISVKSAETYRSRLMEKLGLRNRADLVRFALGCGLLVSGKSAEDS
ncbi:response regulator transcription factor [Candidatus Nitrospira bockiana]